MSIKEEKKNTTTIANKRKFKQKETKQCEHFHWLLDWKLVEGREGLLYPVVFSFCPALGPAHA